MPSSISGLEFLPGSWRKMIPRIRCNGQLRGRWGGFCIAYVCFFQGCRIEEELWFSELGRTEPCEPADEQSDSQPLIDGDLVLEARSPADERGSMGGRKYSSADNQNCGGQKKRRKWMPKKSASPLTMKNIETGSGEAASWTWETG